VRRRRRCRLVLPARLPLLFRGTWGHLLPLYRANDVPLYRQVRAFPLRNIATHCAQRIAEPQ
jgi:hypothetical protein